MTDLMPQVVRHAVTQKGVSAASQSYGVVVLVLLVALLVEIETLRAAGVPPARLIVPRAVTIPLLVAAALTILARLAPYLG